MENFVMPYTGLYIFNIVILIFAMIAFSIYHNKKMLSVVAVWFMATTVSLTVLKYDHEEKNQVQNSYISSVQSLLPFSGNSLKDADFNIDCSKYSNKQLYLMQYPKLEKDATKDKVTVYGDAISKINKINSKALIDNKNIYICWQRGFFDAVLSYNKAAKKYNIPTETISTKDSSTSIIGNIKIAFIGILVLVLFLILFFTYKLTDLNTPLKDNQDKDGDDKKLSILERLKQNMTKFDVLLIVIVVLTIVGNIMVLF